MTKSPSKKRPLPNEQRGEVCDDCPCRSSTPAQDRERDARAALEHPIRVPELVWLVFVPGWIVQTCHAFDSEKVARDVAGKRPGVVIVGPVATSPEKKAAATEPTISTASKQPHACAVGWPILIP